MKKIIIAMIMFLFSFSGVNAGFDCEPIFKDNTYSVQNNKIDKIYEKINTFSVDRKSKIYIKIQENLDSGGKISIFVNKIQKKYGFKSKQYKKMDALYKRIYCDNQKGYNELIDDFFTNFESIKYIDNLNPFNSKKIIRFIYDSNNIFDKNLNINLNKKTFIVLKLNESLGISVDKNFLYFYKKGWPENIRNVTKIKDYKSFKIYDGMLLGDNLVYINGKKDINIDLKTFKRIEKKSVDYIENKKEMKNNFYYEDEAYFYQKRNWGNLEKIGIKNRKLKIISKNVYVYDNKLYFNGEFLKDKNINTFKSVDKFITEQNLMILNIFGRDDKYIYIKSSGYGDSFYKKLEFDYNTFEKVDDTTFKDINNTFKIENDEIIKISK